MDSRIIEKKLQILEGMIIKKSRTISGWEARCAIHDGPDEYRYQGDWHSVPDKTRWPAQMTVFLRTSVEVPDNWEPETTFLQFSFDDIEGLVSVDGRPWSGIDSGHRRCPVPETGKLQLQLELDSVPRAKSQPHLRDTESTFRSAKLIKIAPDIEQAYYDFRFAYEAYDAIDNGRRKQLLGDALEEAMLAFRLSGPRDVIVEELQSAGKLLSRRIEQIEPDPEGGRLFLTGHTHIDVAWLWPLRETIRKCGRTFSTACWMMERYPEYKLSCSQAQLYRFTKKHYPKVYSRMKQYIDDGRWETTGALWVEADCNVTSGESLIRQILHGLEFFREEFGTRPTICWLPDVFGYNAGLPQILKGCGLESFWTWKLHWQAQNEFPHHLFWWEGIDGSRVLAHIPKLGGGGYNSNPTPQQLTKAWDNYRQKGDYDEQLLPFGHGDGGGGVNEQMMEFANRADEFPGLPACRIGTAEKFFKEVHDAAPDLPTWVGELYLETHRGTTTSQARTKWGNRRCELAMRNAEILSTMANRLGHSVDPTPLHETWKTILLQQFHDILPGTSIAEVHDVTEYDQRRMIGTAREIATRAIDPLASESGQWENLCVLNTLSWPATTVAEVPLPAGGEHLPAVDGDTVLPTQIVNRGGGRNMLLIAVEDVPPMGGTVIELQNRPQPDTNLNVSERKLENDFFRIRLNDRGQIRSLYDKRAGREVIADGAVGNELQLFQDGPERESAWNVHRSSTKRQYQWDDDCQIGVSEAGPVRAAVSVSKQFGETSLHQQIRLYHHIPRIDFHTTVDWQQPQTMLKVAFPLRVHTQKVSYEVQFGVVERPTHRNTPRDEEKFEVPAQWWADMSEGDYGVSLLNDCKYGYDALGNVLRLTLLRGPEYPDPEADICHHEFTYALLPHGGDWRDGETVKHGWQLNAHPLTFATDIEPQRRSLIEVSGPAVINALKPADNGDGAILRLYEPHGCRGEITVTFDFPVEQVMACNLVEEDDTEAQFNENTLRFDIEPFQIRTFRLR